MAFLKSKAEEQKAKLMQDSHVKELENSIRWFRGQASKVDQFFNIRITRDTSFRRRKST
jgi:hypothetical protein